MILNTLCNKYQILLLRQVDIPKMVERKKIEYGIVGKNCVIEGNYKVKIDKEFEFGNCVLVLAVINNSKIKKVSQLSGKTIATSYPVLLKKYLKKQKINCKILELSGSVEIAPALGLADAICDLVQTGKTLVDNDLRQIECIFRSNAVMIKK